MPQRVYAKFGRLELLAPRICSLQMTQFHRHRTQHSRTQYFLPWQQLYWLVIGQANQNLAPASIGDEQSERNQVSAHDKGIM
jgi:hypothetical protein